MTASADRLRDRRRAIALPGGAHDRMVGRLAKWLPMGVGVIVAAMVVTPLYPRSEVSFLLDRNRVAITEERLQVSNATYRGEDGQGRPFSLTAGSAVQHSAKVPVVKMRDLVASLQLTDGPAQVAAGNGDYHINTDRMVLAGPVNFRTADGYRMTTSGVAIDLKQRKAFGEGGVTGSLPEGTFSADRIAADLTDRKIALDGHARLRMEQGKITVPK